jgi:hypothetical protein
MNATTRSRRTGEAGYKEKGKSEKKSRKAKPEAAELEQLSLLGFK